MVHEVIDRFISFDGNVFDYKWDCLNYEYDKLKEILKVEDVMDVSKFFEDLGVGNGDEMIWKIYLDTEEQKRVLDKFLEQNYEYAPNWLNCNYVGDVIYIKISGSKEYVDVWGTEEEVFEALKSKFRMF